MLNGASVKFIKYGVHLIPLNNEELEAERATAATILILRCTFFAVSNFVAAKFILFK